LEKSIILAGGELGGGDLPAQGDAT
jgi:hypothetical protein